jgi:hypothetical protein
MGHLKKIRRETKLLLLKYQTVCRLHKALLLRIWLRVHAKRYYYTFILQDFRIAFIQSFFFSIDRCILNNLIRRK